MRNVKHLIGAIVLAVVFNPNVVCAWGVSIPVQAIEKPAKKGGVLKRATLVITSKSKPKSNARRVIRAATPTVQQDLPNEPFLFMIKRKTTAGELYWVLERKGLRSVPLDACWRGRTDGVVVALMDDHKHRFPYYAQVASPSDPRAPVIWHSFSFNLVVMAARQLDPYTKRYVNPALASQNPGSVQRWDPHKCADYKPERIEPDQWRSTGLTIPDEDYVPLANFPEFWPGEAIWVVYNE